MASLEIDREISAFCKFYQENYKLLDTAAEYFRTLINSLLLNNVEIQTVIARVKDRDECISKFKIKYQKSLEDSKTEYEIRNHITDLIGVRVICLYEPDIEKIKDILERNFDVLAITDKISDIESTENQFGYKSLHLDLKLNEVRKTLPENVNYADLQFEIQIRTIIQDAWSVLDHKIKYKKNIPSDLKRRINRLAALFELADEEFNSIKLDTEHFEDATKATAEIPNQPLNIFSFLSISIPTFPTYQFINYKADNFVHEILEISPTLTKEQFQQALHENIDKVKKFNSDLVFQSPTNYLNPYTMIRHCLYLFDKAKFDGVLFEIQKENFNSWLDQ